MTALDFGYTKFTITKYYKNTFFIIITQIGEGYQLYKRRADNLPEEFAAIKRAINFVFRRRLRVFEMPHGEEAHYLTFQVAHCYKEEVKKNTANKTLSPADYKGSSCGDEKINIVNF